MVVKKKSDSSVVPSPAWISLNVSNKLEPKMTVSTSIPTYEGIYLVTVNSKLFNESSFAPSFVFEIYLHPSPCVKSVFNANGTIKLPDLAYDVGPTTV